MTTHEQQASDFKVSLYFKPGQNGHDLRRAVCSCGWTGSWFAESHFVQRSFDRHVEVVNRAPKRDCGHPFLTVGPCVSCPPEVTEQI